MADFEERADQLSLPDINELLVDSATFQAARKKLLARGAKLLVGPRGTGKTHLMRYTYSVALGDRDAPVALYANFSKYLHLEPFLAKSPDALKKFRAWIFAKLIVAAFDLRADAITSGVRSRQTPIAHDERSLRQLIALLEGGGGDELYESVGQYLTVDDVLAVVEEQRKAFGRKRAILLLDDAALSLADQYLVAFFQVFRVLKTETIAPKASVYPGSTQYGPTFHVSHETEEIPLWLSVEDANYLEIMGEIAGRRLPTQETGALSQDTLELLKYSAFGIPRFYLRLIREHINSKGTSAQQRINKVMEGQTALIGAEYDSLGIKLPQFASVVEIGRRFFESMISEVVSAQSKEPLARNIVFGLQQGPGRTPLVERMLRFLVEVGMLYPMQSVSHGPNRKYDRYIPHLAFLRQAGGFRDGKNPSFRDLAVHMRKSPAKHPVRREISSLLTPDELSRLKLNLPVCGECQTARLNESQRFCHNCGHELVSSSLFESCMTIRLEKVPGISKKIIRRIHSGTEIRTIGDVYSSQSAAKDLQAAKYIGSVRAGDLIAKVQLVVSEFLS